MGDSWLEQIANQKIFREVDSQSQAAKMLARTKTNRIVLPGKQASALVAVRVMAARLSTDDPKANPWGWLDGFADMIEEYQLTLGAPKNSRDQFLAALKREMTDTSQGSSQGRGFGK